MPPPIPRPIGRPPSDENLVITVIALSLLTSAVLGIGIYQFLQYQHQQDQERLNSRAYRSYVRHTDQEQIQTTAPEQTPEPPSLARQPSQAQINQDMTRKLLSHPGVIPEAGFTAPGVRSTGVLIIDAIDQAKAREKAQALQRPPS